MVEKKEITIEFDEIVPDIIKNLNFQEDAWVYRKLVKKFVKNINDIESYDEIFEEIALNPNTSPDLLYILKNYEDEDVRENVALNPNTPKSILRELSKDESPYVRMALLKRDDVDIEFIKLLYTDKGEYFSEDEYEYEYYEDDNFESTINELKQLTADLKSAIDEDEELHEDYEYSDNEWDEEAYDYFDDDIASEIRVLIASNSKTPSDILKKLSNDEDEDVRKAVAMNKKTGITILRKLSQDGSDMVKAAIFAKQRKDLKIKLSINNHIEWINR